MPVLLERFFGENAREDWGLPCPIALPVPGSLQGSRVGPLARTAQKASRYCLDFTVAGLRPDLAAVIPPSTWHSGGIGAKGTIDERSAIAWLVNQVNRFGLSVPNTRSPISGCTKPPMPPEP